MHIIIIGNGIAGSTAARFIRKLSDHRITMISAESDYPYSRTALMYVYMGHVRYEDTKLYEDWFWGKNRIDLIKGVVRAVNPGNKSIDLEDGTRLDYDSLIIACGSKSNMSGWEGQDLNGVQGLYSLQDLEKLELKSKHISKAVIVGGGLIGIEMAEMLHSRDIRVTMLVREKSFWSSVLPAEESALVNREIREHGIDLQLASTLKKISDDGTGTIKNVVTEDGRTIDCQFAGLTVGVSPNVEFLNKSDLEINKGILVDEFLETNHPGIYAIGDCAEIRSPKTGRRAIEPIWYTGRIMGQTVALTVCRNKTAYDPGIWFNSAKFFDVEYQVYGDIPAEPMEGKTSIYWEHPDGKKSIRIAYETATGFVLGFNLMGVRFRQQVCEKWIAGKFTIDQVLQNLALANFDPEFFAAYESGLIQKYNEMTGSRLIAKKERNLNSVVRFLRGTFRES